MNWSKRLIVMALVGAFTAGTAVSSFGASVPAAVMVPVGGVVDVAAAGVTSVDVSPAGVAGVWASVDHVTMWGLQGGTATLVLSWPGGVIEARPVDVTPPNSGHVLFANGGCPGSLGMTAAAPLGTTGTSAPRASDVTWSPGEWQVLWNAQGDGRRLVVAQSLDSPVDMLGVQSSPGVNLVWDRWTVTASQTMGALAYQLPLGSGLMMQLGDSTLGPIGEATVAAGGVTASGVALLSQTGQVLAAARATLGLGPVDLGYLVSPVGNVGSVQFRRGPVQLSAAVSPADGPSVALVVGLGTSASFEGTWALQTGWAARVALSLGPGSVPGSATNPSVLPSVFAAAASCGLGMTSPAPATQQ